MRTMPFNLGILLLLMFIFASCGSSENPQSRKMPEKESTMTWSDVERYAREGSPKPDRRVEKTPEQWRAQLTKEQYAVTRMKGTERPYTGEYCESHEPGIYACVCCRTELFDSRVKFESGTGWPSFTEPIKVNVISYHEDESYGMSRIEVLCNVCDAHLGHVFPDGPGKGGLRFCINSASLVQVDSVGNAITH
jgi:peptide-methionine (R)-S-oxide reductase